MITHNKGIFVRTTKCFNPSLFSLFQKLLISGVSHPVASSRLGLCLLNPTLHYCHETTEAMPVLKITSVILFYHIFQNTETNGENFLVDVSLHWVA